MALRIIELVKSLPLDEQQAVRDALVCQPAPTARSPLDVARSLHGRFAGGKLLDTLLRERALDREREAR